MGLSNEDIHFLLKMIDELCKENEEYYNELLYLKKNFHDQSITIKEKMKHLQSFYKKIQMTNNKNQKQITKVGKDTRKRNLNNNNNNNKENIDENYKKIKVNIKNDLIEYYPPTMPPKDKKIIYQKVPIILIPMDCNTNNDNNIYTPYEKEILIKIRQFRFSGIPFVLKGNTSEWLNFARTWTNDTKSIFYENKFLNGIGNEKVPILIKGYNDFKPIKKYMTLNEYITKHWKKSKDSENNEYYLHQWQFPNSKNAHAVLGNQSKEFEKYFGINLLNYWLDNHQRGDNPLQYIFMGNKSTFSRMHQDPGGMAITITPIYGQKHVQMLHRNVKKFDIDYFDSIRQKYNTNSEYLLSNPNLVFYPAYEVILNPGDILFMPEGTFHACKNLTDCISYSRFFLDTINLYEGFFQSFIRQDAPEISHEEIIWNASHDLINELEEVYTLNKNKIINTDINFLRKLDALRGLHHLVFSLSVQKVLPTDHIWEWNKLLFDIDSILEIVDMKSQSSKIQQSTVSSFESKNPNETKIVENVKKESIKCIKNNKTNQLSYKIGDIIGIMILSMTQKAKIVKIRTNVKMFKIRYIGWSSDYDEYKPLDEINLININNTKKSIVPTIGTNISIKWKNKTYKGKILDIVKSDAYFVHSIEKDNKWEQWILPTIIIKEIK